MILKTISFFFLTKLIHQQYIFSQIPEDVHFSPTTQEKRVELNLGDFEFVKEYTLWGWFKFKGETSAISNILTMKNIEPFPTGDPSAGPYPNASFPVCPVSANELTINPSLLNDPSIQNNPNCLTQNKSIKSKGPDYLYVNYDLNPVVNNQPQTYSLVFLIQSGLAASGNSDMKIEGFLDIPFEKDIWGFFAISCDYSQGQVYIYYKIFNSPQGQVKTKNFGINFPGFQLKKFGQIVFAGVENNPYFQSTSGFIGNIAYVEIGLFFTSNLESLWVSFTNLESFAYRSLISDFYFEETEKNNKVSAQGATTAQYVVNGKYSPLYLIDNNLIGMRLYDGASINMGFIDFQNAQHTMKSFVFFFQLSFKESMPSQMILLTRGSSSVNGYIGIFMEAGSAGRNPKIVLKGSNADLNWKSPSTFKQEEKFWMMFGVIISPALAARVVYNDSKGINKYELLSNSFSFDTSNQEIIIASDNTSGTNSQSSTGSTSFDGYLDLQRVSLLNSGSSAYYSSLVNTAVNSKIKSLNDKCELRISAQKNNYGCIRCKNSIRKKSDFSCVNSCPVNQKNALTDVCVDCIKDKCSEIDTTSWKLERQNNNTFRMYPSREIMSNTLNFENMISMTVGGLPPSDDTFSYKIVPAPDNKYVDIVMDFKNPIANKELSVSVKDDPNNPHFDINRNRIYSESALMNIDRVCQLDDTTNNILQIMAYIILILILLSFLLVLTATILRRKTYNLGVMWKFLLNNWMVFQFVCFLLFVGIYMPCCAVKFFSTLYKWGVSWDHILRGFSDNIHESNDIYLKGFTETALPRQFTQEDIKSPLLHNMGPFFIIHILIFIFYIVMKIWDSVMTKTIKLVYKIFIFTEFTLLIVGYLIVHMQSFVFSLLNLKFSYFSHSYFIVSFLISLCYILVFVFSWLIFAGTLFGPTPFFKNPTYFNKYYYFFCGQKSNNGGKTFDLYLLLIYFLSGIIIALFTSNYIIQISLLILLVLILFLIILIAKPFSYSWMNWTFLFVWGMILIGLLFFMIIAFYDNQNCFDCGGREGWFCWLFILPFFLALTGAFISLIGFSYMLAFNPKKLYLMNQKKSLAKKASGNNILEEHKTSTFGAETNRYLVQNDINEQRMINEQDTSIYNQSIQNSINQGSHNSQLGPNKIINQHNINETITQVHNVQDIGPNGQYFPNDDLNRNTSINTDNRNNSFNIYHERNPSIPINPSRNGTMPVNGIRNGTMPVNGSLTYGQNNRFNSVQVGQNNKLSVNQGMPAQQIQPDSINNMQAFPNSHQSIKNHPKSNMNMNDFMRNLHSQRVVEQNMNHQPVQSHTSIQRDTVAQEVNMNENQQRLEPDEEGDISEFMYDQSILNEDKNNKSILDQRKNFLNKKKEQFYSKHPKNQSSFKRSQQMNVGSNRRNNLETFRESNGLQMGQGAYQVQREEPGQLQLPPGFETQMKQDIDVSTYEMNNGETGDQQIIISNTMSRNTPQVNNFITPTEDMTDMVFKTQVNDNSNNINLDF